MNRKSKFEDRASHWRGIIAKANEHPVSHHAFCIEEGISKSSFYWWRNRLSECLPKATHQMNLKTPLRPLRLPSVFAEVKIEERQPSLSQQMLIDPKWLADFLLHLHGGIR